MSAYTIVAAVVIGLGLFLDLVSLVLYLKRLFGDGPSGVPLIPLLLYFVGAGLAYPVLGMVMCLLLVGFLIIVHLSCQYLIVQLVFTISSRSKDEGTERSKGTGDVSSPQDSRTD